MSRTIVLFKISVAAIVVAMTAPVAFGGDLPPASNCDSKIMVPPGLRWAPFDVDRTLCLPSGFSIEVVARIGGARFLAFTPEGRLLVSQPGDGAIYSLDPDSSTVSTFASGLNLPHDMYFQRLDGQQYLYVAEADHVWRMPWIAGDTAMHDAEVMVSDLPSASLPELQGAYAHQLKSLVISRYGHIFVSVASATNADPAEREANPVRGSVQICAPDKSGCHAYAIGLRNAEGLRILPYTDDIWAAVNNRDNVAIPYEDGSGSFGVVSQEYVNNHPPDELTFVRDRGDYGWPLANPTPDTSNGWDDMPFEADAQNNPNGSVRSPDTFDRISKGIPAHSAALGLTFLHDTAFPAEFNQGALIALHGSWNRTPPTGYKVVYFPWSYDTRRPGVQQDFITGWMDASGNVWGRPVSTAVGPDGALYVSDDYSGTIYRLHYQVPEE